jgi:hypothetical protein
MLTKNTSKVFAVLFVLAAVFVSVSFVTHSNPASAIHAYDSVEQVRASRSLPHVSNIASYDQIENVRAQRALSLSADTSYSALEQLRTARGLSADRSYDAVENVRSLWNNIFSASVFGYDQIETLRTLRNVPSMATNSGYELVEQLRIDRGIRTDHSYDQIESLRLGR